MTTAPKQPHHVVIVGAGFGGLETAFGLAGAPVRITLIDRRNHHLFQPLLYQVATASLATSEIAWPIRYLLRGRKEVTTLFANVSGVDAAGKRVLLDDGDALAYDTLVLATGARHAYFGHDEWEPFAPGPEDAGGCHHAAAAHPRRLRARRARDRSGAARGAVDLRHHRRRPDRRRNGRNHRRPRQGHAAAGLSQHRHPQDPRRPGRGRPARSGQLSRGSLRLRAALAGGDRRRGGAGAARHRMRHRWRRLWRQQAGGQNHRLGRRRARLARGGMAERARRPRLPFEGRARPDRARPSRHLCRWRHRDHRRPRRQSRAGHRAGGQAAGTLRGGADQGAPRAAARCRRSATSMPAASRRSARKRR